MISKFIKSQFKSALVLGALLIGGSTNAQLGITWNEMGPNDIGGRTRSIVIDNQDPSHKTIYAAGVSGGIFKSTDNGGNWSLINDQAPSLIVSCMAQKANGNIVFGTGETFGRGDFGGGQPTFFGSGLYELAVSTGSITQFAPGTDFSLFGNINEVAIDGNGVVYVAADLGFFYNSVSSPGTFTKETASMGSLSAMDVKVSKNNDIYISAGVPWATNSKVFLMPSGSTTLSNITPTTYTNRGRIEIAPSPVDNNYVYLSIAKQVTTTTTSGGLSAICVSDNKGTSWKTITIGSTQFDPLSSATSAGFGDYANTIIAGTTNKEQVFVGGQYLYRWDQIVGNPLGQGTWVQIGNPFAVGSQLYLSSNIHDIKFSPLDPSVYFVATDAGLFRASAPPTGFGLTLTPFIAINKNYRTSQFNSVAFPIYPLTTISSNTAIPYAGLAGGSVGNSLVYVPGYLNTTQTSNTYGSGFAHQTDFSRHVPKAVFYSGVYGVIGRTSDIDVTAPSTFYDNSYKAGNGSPGSSTFANFNTAMRLWEQDASKDSAIFYNQIDTVVTNNNSASKVNFVFKNSRQQASTKYDSILVSAVSKKAPSTAVATQTIQLIPTYSGNTLTGISVNGDANTSATTNNTIYINASLKDSISITFANAPNDSSEITIIYKYRYDAGDVITIDNTDISGHYFTASYTLPNPIGSALIPAPIAKVPLAKSARLAVGRNGKSGNDPNVYVVKRPLSFSINPDWIKIAGKNSKIDGPGGIPTNVTSPVLGRSVTRLEWSNNGTEIYFSTQSLDADTFYLYRISHLDFIGDSSAADYSGKFASDIDSTSLIARKGMRQRTTAIGAFLYPITGISVSSSDTTILVTCGGYNNSTATVYMSNGNVKKLAMNNSDASNFTSKNGITNALPLIPAYTSIFEMNDNKKVLVGTDNGIYSTPDITLANPAWSKETGGGFPANVPVMQIRQQKIESYKCYNSGVIYVATAGRGLWSTNKYLNAYGIGIEEKENNLSFSSTINLFPNPATDATQLAFNAQGDASYKITVYDISGRTLITQNTGKLMAGDQLIQLNTTSLNSGVYFVSINGTNNFNATTKMVISK